MMSARQSGFTLVELLIVLLIVSILARIAVPAYQDLVFKTRAASALADIQVVRVAAYQYNAETNLWPPDVNRGVVPPALRPYLGEGFTFDRGGYLLDWDNWMMPDGSPTNSSGILIGISITTTEEAFGNALVALVGPNTAKYSIGEHYTFIIAAQ